MSRVGLGIAVQRAMSRMGPTLAEARSMSRVGLGIAVQRAMSRMGRTLAEPQPMAGAEWNGAPVRPPEVFGEP